MEIWGLKTCDTCRKARKALPDAAFRDVRAVPLRDAEIARVLAAFGDAAVNKASTTWRAMAEAERRAGPAALLAAHPALMKRPVIWTDGGGYLGWGPAVRAALGLA